MNATMASRTEKIEVSAQTAELIRRRAAGEGVSIDDYLRALAEGLGAAEARTQPPADLDEVLNELASTGKDLPPLPDDFSRADIYGDSN